METMSSLIERYPTVKRVKLPATGRAGSSDPVELMRPYAEWQLGELEHGHALLLYKRPDGTAADHLHERLVILLGEVAAAWLKSRAVNSQP